MNETQTSEQLRSWFRNVEPLCAELFNVAHAITGNYELAEYALRSAIVEVWLQNAGSGMGFRERLRSALRQEAVAAALSEDAEGAEFTWRGVGEGGGALALAAQERPELQRALMLRYGCALPVKTIARLTDLSPARIRTELERFEARFRRTLSGPDRGRAEALIARSFRRHLARPAPDAPQPAQLYRAFEAEAEGTRLAGHRATRVVVAALAVVMALLCAGAFWLFAVLVQPPTF